MHNGNEAEQIDIMNLINVTRALRPEMTEDQLRFEELKQYMLSTNNKLDAITKNQVKFGKDPEKS